MTKKFFGVLLACVAAFGLTSCGQKEGKAVYVLSDENLEKVLKEYKSVGDFHEGLAVVGKEVKDNQVFYGYINTDAELVVPVNYKNAGSFSDGLAAVATTKKVKKDGFEQDVEFWGYVNDKGEEVIACDYASAGEFGDGLAVVTKDEKSIVINEDGEKVYELPKDYTFVSDAKYYDGLVPVKKSIKDGDKYGYLDKEGKEATKFIYDKVGNFYECGYAKVTLNGTEFYIDTKENKHLKQDIKDEVNEELKWFNDELK
jgi:hypothetical protein